MFEVLLPAPGEYILKIFAVSNKYSEKDTYTNICLYQINCSEITTTPTITPKPPFPAVNMFYGISALNAQLVARPISHPGAVVDCNENGEACVVINAVAKDISFSHDLLDTSIPARLLQNYVLYSREDDTVTFTVRTPKRGNYALALYSNVDDTSSNKLTPFCYYLVTSSKQNQEVGGFPSVPNKLVGCIQPSFDALSLDNILCHPADGNNWKSGILHTDCDAECCIVFSHSKPLTIIAELMSAEIDHSDYTSVETNGRTTAVTIRAPVQDPCSLKIYAAELSQAMNLPSVYVAIVFSKPQHATLSPLPQCSIRTWGPAGITAVKYGLTGLNFRNSVSALQKCNVSDFVHSGPTRIYNGGGDFELDLILTEPLQLKAKLQNLDGNPENLENFVFLSKADLNSATVRIRFSNTGSFLLVVYGCAIDDTSGQLSPLAYSLVHVRALSDCTSLFPVAFSVWGASARQLFSPLDQVLQRNREVVVKAFLAKYQRSDDGWVTDNYPEVMAVVDGSSPVTTMCVEGSEYEWKYVAGPGENVFGILVKSEEDSDAMTYALQFKVA